MGRKRPLEHRFRPLPGTGRRPVWGRSADALAKAAVNRVFELDAPKWLSLIGFHDLELAYQLYPVLTTVHVPAEVL